MLSFCEQSCHFVKKVDKKRKKSSLSIELSHVIHLTITQEPRAHCDQPNQQFKTNLLSAVFLMPYPDQDRICQCLGVITKNLLQILLTKNILETKIQDNSVQSVKE